MNSVSIVIPAKNESGGLNKLLPDLVKLEEVREIIVVDDGSTDDTAEVCRKHGVRLVRHPYSKGNGAAIKTGASSANGQIIVFMDADGQHNAIDVVRLINHYQTGYAMVVGARSNQSQASVARLAANTMYNRMASMMVGHKVEDLTSGFRIVNAQKFRKFLHLLPNGFSYPTTSTMAFFRSGYSVGYIPIVADKRIGKSHISILKDGSRFLLIIFKLATLYSPLKIFVPISLGFFVSGFGYYIYTFFSSGRFTNMSALLFSTSIIVFLIGLVSEQVTTLLYSRSDNS